MCYRFGFLAFGWLWRWLHSTQAKRAYAWSHLEGKKDDRTRFVVVLEIPPVDSAQKAVQVKSIKISSQTHLSERLDNEKDGIG